MILKNIDFQKVIEKVSFETLKFPDNGKVAAYIPPLARVNPNKFGISLVTLDGKIYSFGDYDEKFSIQSIAKVFALAIAYNLLGKELWKRVGVEPSGTPFNSLVQLEYDKGIPRNPFINAGALVISDVLLEHLENPKRYLIEYVRKLCDCENIDYNPEIAEGEKAVGYRNAAIVNLMKDFGNIKNDVDEVLDFYFNLCSIEMTTVQLAKSFLLFAAGGILPHSGERILTVSKTKRINAIMQTCGFYDEAGEFAFKVGLPGKSGVGGGIAAIHPGYYSVAVWSPRLNEKGNSISGMKALELLTTETQLSIF